MQAASPLAPRQKARAAVVDRTIDMQGQGATVDASIYCPDRPFNMVSYRLRWTRSHAFNSVVTGRVSRSGRNCDRHAGFSPYTFIRARRL